MIHGCKFRGKFLKFHDRSIDDEANIYTIVVGKNGVGKSLLLQQLICAFVPLNDRVSERTLFSRNSDFLDFGGNLQFSQYPSKIIASSTSPFDKFPLDQKRDYESIYEYLGLKGLPSSHLSLGFLGKTIGSLIKALSEDKGRLNGILGVFDYLGYSPYLKARMVLDLQPHKVREILNAEDPQEALTEQMMRRGNTLFIHEGTRKAKITDNKIFDILEALNYFIHMKIKPRIDIVINSRGVFDEETGAIIDTMFSDLLAVGLLKVRDVALRKSDMHSEIQISDASSGEQCVLMALLGIASHIQDDSLICIDEPEICLHPEWQEKYIELIMESFKGFRGCHFIIATHSPQIVSNLANQNCFVLDLHKGETVGAGMVNRKSADFQLASVFGAPGFKNEYLSREIVSALSALSAGEDLSQARLDVLNGIVELKSLIDPDDPVYRLIGYLSEALEGL